MQQVKVFCTNVMNTHTAFAVRADNGDEVFIPSAVAHAVKLQPADTVIAHIVPNTRHPEKTPWFAISIERDVEQGAIDEKILAYLSGTAYASTSEIAQEFSTDATTASNALNRLFRRGRLAKAEVYSRPGQERATTCLWATEAGRFTDYDE
jgi:hypothetical protein